MENKSFLDVYPIWKKWVLGSGMMTLGKLCFTVYIKKYLWYILNRIGMENKIFISRLYIIKGNDSISNFLLFLSQILI